MKGERQQAVMQRINCYIPAYEKLQLERLSDQSGESLSHWVRYALRLLFKEKENVINNNRRRGFKS
jgi:hypothetical protein